MARDYDNSGYRDTGDLQEGDFVQEQSFSSAWLRYGTRNMMSGLTEVQFNDGFVWSGQMSERDWHGLLSAPSKGRFWHALMRRGVV